MLPPRTEILRVMPQGLNTPIVESLLSFVIRTAHANHVSVGKMVSQKIAVGKRLEALRFSERLVGPSTAVSINGCGELTELLVKRLEDLSRHTGLRRCTTLQFAHFTTNNGLLRPTHAWSPEFSLASKTAYYPLVWSLQSIMVCPVARSPLRALCPKCSSKVPALTGNAHIGRCPRCGGDLCRNPGTANPNDPICGGIIDLDYELWIADEVGAFIAAASRFIFPVDFSFSRALRHWLQVFDLDTNTK